MKDDYTTNSHYITNTFWENVLYFNLGVKGLTVKQLKADNGRAQRPLSKT